MLAPGISTDKQAKKCVSGVFLKLTRIALVCKNLVIDIVLESGSRWRNHTFLKCHLNIWLEDTKNMEVVQKSNFVPTTNQSLPVLELHADLL